MSFVVSFNGQFKNYVYPNIEKKVIERTRGAQFVSLDATNSDELSINTKAEQKKYSAKHAYQEVVEQKEKHKKIIHIRDLIKKNLITIKDKNSIDEAKKIMIQKKIHHLPVLNDEGVLCGIISDRDILRNQRGHLVSDIMKTEVISAYGSARVSDAAKIMLHERFSSLPIVNDDHILEGIITLTDILRYVVKMDDFEISV